MANYDNGDNDINEDGNDNNNAASVSGSNGSIFGPITTPRSHEEGSGNDGNGTAAAAHYMSMCRTIYLLYKDHIKDVPYTDICQNWRFGLELLKHEKFTS